MTIYNGLIKQLWERRVFRKELEWDEYENLIYLIKLLTFFGQEMHGDQEYEKKTVYRKNLQTFDSLYIMGMERHLYSLV